MRVSYLLQAIILVSLSLSHADTTIGCTASQLPETSCTESNPLKSSSFELTDLAAEIPQKSTPTHETPTETPKRQTIPITEAMPSLTLTYQDQTIDVQRTPHTTEQSCPPYCIQPLRIDKVQTVGELEVLNFIASLSQQKGALLVDARIPTLYKYATLPTATNIPYTLIQTKSPHREAVLKLLGATQKKGKWRFDHVRELLLFDTALWDFQAVSLIKDLIKLGYPQDHLLYYRGGIRSWKEAGLSLD